MWRRSTGGAVAELTIGGEAGRGVIRIGDAVVVLQVTVEQAVPSPAYLLLTWHCAHCTVVCLPVNGNLVVEWLNVAPAIAWWCGRASSPAGRPRGVIWIGGALVFGQVAARAGGGRTGERLPPVTLRAAVGVLAGEAKLGCVVIEGRALPLLMVWQVAQVVGKPAAVWLGLVVFWKSGRWQPRSRWACLKMC